MGKEEIIEEIRNYIKENAEMGWVNADEVLRKINEVIPPYLVPEGAVVLTREEYEELKNLDISYDALEDQYFNLMKKAGEIRKETAKQSCNDIIKIIKNNTDLNASVFGWTTDFILNMIKAYFKEKFGVGVEE